VPGRARRPLGTDCSISDETPAAAAAPAELRSCFRHELREGGERAYELEDGGGVRPTHRRSGDTEEELSSDRTSDGDGISSDGGAGRCADREVWMDAFFAGARQRLAAVRRLFESGDSAGMRAEARALARSAAGAGSRSVQDAAIKLWDGRGSGGGAGWAAWAGEQGPVRRAAVDGLELQMDAAEAIWRSCRVVV
jgi:hypothetical protein